MPLSGHGGAGANVWVQDGSVWAYLAHGGAFDENGNLLKLGCLRLTPAGGLLAVGQPMRQELDLATGSIRITAGGGAWAARLWFAGQTLVIEVETSGPRDLAVAYGTWRDRDYATAGLDIFGDHPLRADRVHAAEAGLAWAHHNADHSSRLAGQLELQPWAVAGLHDPTAGLVFGGALAAEPALLGGAAGPVAWQTWSGTAWTFACPAASRQRVAVALRAGPDGEPLRWLAEARALLEPAALAAARLAEDERWRAFWQRSWMVVNPDAGPGDLGWQVGRNYQLFRYMLACNQGGSEPLLFNGGIFTVDNPPGRIAGNNNDELVLQPKGPCLPDFRRWLFCHFMSQNQRWLGWPGILAGDADLVAPSLAFYRQRMATAAARAVQQGAVGVLYPEPIDIRGLCCVSSRADGLCGAPHLTYAWSMMLEHAWMALHAHTTLALDIAADLPWITGTVRFFDSYYRAQARARTGAELGADGRLAIHPANSLELSVGATNPIEVVAGLRRITGALQQLPEAWLSAAERAEFAAIAARIPALPTGMVEGRAVLRFDEGHDKLFNMWELPEFYAVWPYRLVGVTHPGTIPLARATWESLPPERMCKVGTDYSWMPVVVNMAGLGDAGAARERVIDKLSDRKAQVRFPAFFGPGHDWLPDHNWGGSGMVGLQEMLLSADPFGDPAIRLLPAWPRDWDVDFRLHAPGQTVVTGSLRQGRLTALEVVPAARRADIVLPPDLAGSLP